MVTKTSLHERILDSDKIRGIQDERSKKRIWRFTFIINVMTACLPILPTFRGYDYVSIDGIVLEILFDLLALAYLYFFIRLTLLVHKYHFFRKTINYYLLYLPYLLMVLTMCVLPLFTGELTVSEHGVTFQNNVAYYFVVFLPVLFAYVVFMTFATTKGYAEGLKPKKAENQEDQH
jgi:hypothetical protein